MKVMLTLATPRQFELFQKMYDYNKSFEHPVNAIPVEKLDWAFKQIENTFAKLSPNPLDTIQ